MNQPTTKVRYWVLVRTVLSIVGLVIVGSVLVKAGNLQREQRIKRNELVASHVDGCLLDRRTKWKCDGCDLAILQTRQAEHREILRRVTMIAERMEQDARTAAGKMVDEELGD